MGMKVGAQVLTLTVESGVVQRRSTTNVFPHLMHVVALIAEILGAKRRHDMNWEDSCAAVKKHLWLTDCQSLRDYCCNPSAAAPEDKRLEIDLEGL